MDIRLKRIYDEPTDADGYRILVDRIWPRGVKKEAAKLDEWIKDIAPSTALRTWFGHQPERFDEFARRYTEELQAKEEQLLRIREMARSGTVTLLFGARDPEINQAVVLRRFLLHA